MGSIKFIILAHSNESFFFGLRWFVRVGCILGSFVQNLIFLICIQKYKQINHSLIGKELTTKRYLQDFQTTVSPLNREYGSLPSCRASQDVFMPPKALPLTFNFLGTMTFMTLCVFFLLIKVEDGFPLMYCD